jgi:lipoate-protein ligase B
MILQTRPRIITQKMNCLAYFPGVIEYTKAAHLQEQLRQERGAGRIGDSLLVLEHPPVLTVGKAGYKAEHLLVTPETLEREGIPICQANRGGGITYHGPGQLVCYPILDLRGLDLTVRRYLIMLEEVIISTLSQFEIRANRKPGSPGVWVKDAEISSIGINVSHGITMHGFTLNINNDLKQFSYINACGVPGKKITTLERAGGIKTAVSSMVKPVTHSFAEIFNIEVLPGHIDTLEGSYG